METSSEGHEVIGKDSWDNVDRFHLEDPGVRYNRKEAHCPGASLCDTAGAIPQSAVTCGVVVGVRDVACVAVVCHDDVDRDACFDGDRVNLLAEDPVEALREVGDSSSEGVLVDNCVFQSNSKSVVSVGGTLAGSSGDKAVQGPWFEDWVELRASVFGPKSVDNAGEGKDAVV